MGNPISSSFSTTTASTAHRKPKQAVPAAPATKKQSSFFQAPDKNDFNNGRQAGPMINFLK